MKKNVETERWQKRFENHTVLLVNGNSQETRSEGLFAILSKGESHDVWVCRRIYGI